VEMDEEEAVGVAVDGVMRGSEGARVRTSMHDAVRGQVIYNGMVKSAVSTRGALAARGKQPRQASGMQGMLRGLGLELQGQHHWGMHDCSNLVRVVIELLRMVMPPATSHSLATLAPLSPLPPSLF